MSGVFDPVGWRCKTPHGYVIGKTQHASADEAVYSQAAIDTLRAQLEAAEARAEAAEAECARLLAALGTVADWDLPATGETWPSGGAVSYEAQYGSNGAREFIRTVARKAIDAARTKEDAA